MAGSARGTALGGYTDEVSGGTTMRVITLRLSDGSTLSPNQSGSAAFAVGRVLLPGTVNDARASGSLSSSGSSGFTPRASSISSLNNKRTLTFNVLGTAAQAGLSLVTVDVVGGRVVLVQATVGLTTQGLIALTTAPWWPRGLECP